MSFDLHDSRVMTGLLGTVAAAVLWIYRLGGKMREQEISIKNIATDVSEIEGKLAKGEAVHRETAVQLAELNVSQKHILRTMDRILSKVEKP